MYLLFIFQSFSNLTFNVTRISVHRFCKWTLSAFLSFKCLLSSLWETTARSSNQRFSVFFFMSRIRLDRLSHCAGWERISELAKQEILLHLEVKRCAPGLIEYPQTAYQFWEYLWGHTTPFPLCRGVYVQSKMKAHNGFEGGKWV